MEKKIDFSKAPDWANGWATVGPDSLEIWVGDDCYSYVTDKRGPTYQWADRAGSLINRHRSELKDFVKRPVTTWNGEGLPPVGVVCAVFSDSPHKRWKKHVGEPVTIIAHSTGFNGTPTAVYKVFDAEDSEYHALIAGGFRPIKTAEQIAAEEREKAIQEMVEIYLNHDGDRDSSMAAVYDAGFKKQ